MPQHPIFQAPTPHWGVPTTGNPMTVAQMLAKELEKKMGEKAKKLSPSTEWLEAFGKDVSKSQPEVEYAIPTHTHVGCDGCGGLKDMERRCFLPDHRCGLKDGENMKFCANCMSAGLLVQLVVFVYHYAKPFTRTLWDGWGVLCGGCSRPTIKSGCRYQDCGYTTTTKQSCVRCEKECASPFPRGAVCMECVEVFHCNCNRCGHSHSPGMKWLHMRAVLDMLKPINLKEVLK